MSVTRRSRTRRSEEPLSPEEIRAHLRERIYGAFSCLTTLLVLLSHVGHGGSHAAWGAALDVTLTCVSLYAASLFSEFLAHIVAHQQRLTRSEWLHMARSCAEIVSAGVPSVLLLAVAGVGWLDYRAALVASVVILVVSLALFVHLAVRRTPLPWWQKWLLMAALVGVAFVVVGLKLAAH